MKGFTEFLLIKYAKTVEEKETFMKRFAFLMILAMSFVLSGCVIEFSELPDSFTIADAGFSTNHRVDLGTNGVTEASEQPEFVICNDLPTDLIYRFSYTGSLSSFRSFLRGEDTGSIPRDGDVTFQTNGLGNPVEVKISIPAGLAPRLVAPSSSQPNAITPIGIIGYTKLFLDFPGDNQDKGSRRIAIIDNCP
jgi:hypothetical protein